MTERKEATVSQIKQFGARGPLSDPPILGEYIMVTYADHLAALRACEQRVAEETEAAMMEFFYWKPSPPHDQHYFADNICAYCVGYREAFTAARKAVAALPEYKMRDTCVAAIDALKEES